MKVNIFKNKTKLMRGFTLIELLVVISIIGMLASVVLVSLQGAKSKARDSKFTLEIKELQKALELYRLDNGHYPRPDGWYHGTSAACAVGGAGPQHVLTEAGLFDDTFRSKYMSVLPTEVIPCGIYYIAFSNTEEATSIDCKDGNNVTVQPDGFNGPSKIVGTNANGYLILIRPLTNISNIAYPNVYWPGLDPTLRCVLGPVL
jgi:prepilin-type N-terminal cleavage/methylation domain-containing protein